MESEPIVNRRIMIIEDDEALRRVLKLKFESNGINATTAEGCDEALGILEKETFDLVILDIIMPEADGFSFLKKLKEKGINVPVVVMSLLAHRDDIKKAHELGAKDYFVKNQMSVTEIVDRINNLL